MKNLLTYLIVMIVAAGCRFPYAAGEYKKSLVANSKAIDAANNFIDEQFLDKSILTDIEVNRQKIIRRNWNELK